MNFEGQLSAIIVLYETRKFFGTRSSERLAPSAALFELAHARFLEQEARGEAVRTLEDVTQRVHSEYDRKLALLEEQLFKASGASPGADPERLVALEREVAHAVEDARRAHRRAEAVEVQVTAAVDQLDKTHIELHRRSESLRQKTRTLYLIERVLRIDRLRVVERVEQLGLAIAGLPVVEQARAVRRGVEQHAHRAMPRVAGDPLGQGADRVRRAFDQLATALAIEHQHPADVAGTGLLPRLTQNLYEFGRRGVGREPADAEKTPHRLRRRRRAERHE